MHPKSGPRRRHSDELKAKVLAACDEAGDVARCDEEHDEDEGRDHPEDDEPEHDPVNQEARHPYRLKSRSPRGSKASRMLSPRRLNESVVINRAKPGSRTNHQATR